MGQSPPWVWNDWLVGPPEQGASLWGHPSAWLGFEMTMIRAFPTARIDPEHLPFMFYRYLTRPTSRRFYSHCTRIAAPSRSYPPSRTRQSCLMYVVRESGVSQIYIDLSSTSPSGTATPSSPPSPLPWPWQLELLMTRLGVRRPLSKVSTYQESKDMDFLTRLRLEYRESTPSLGIATRVPQNILPTSAEIESRCIRYHSQGERSEIASEKNWL